MEKLHPKKKYTYHCLIEKLAVCAKVFDLGFHCNLYHCTAFEINNDRHLYCRETDFEKEWDRVPLGRLQWKSEEEAKVCFDHFGCNHFSNPIKGVVLSSQMERSIINIKKMRE